MNQVSLRNHTNFGAFLTLLFIQDYKDTRAGGNNTNGKGVWNNQKRIFEQKVPNRASPAGFEPSQTRMSHPPQKREGDGPWANERRSNFRRNDSRDEDDHHNRSP